MGDQQSFLADKETFEQIMSFISYIIENKIVEYVKSHKYRRRQRYYRPSFLIARYFGVKLHLLDVPTKLISLKHLNKREWR